MEWLSAENLVAVATAMLGIVASAVMVRYERRVPRRRRIGYRVQLDVPIGDDQRSGRRINRRVGWFDTAAGMTDARPSAVLWTPGGLKPCAPGARPEGGVHAVAGAGPGGGAHGVRVLAPW